MLHVRKSKSHDNLYVLLNYENVYLSDMYEEGLLERDGTLEECISAATKIIIPLLAIHNPLSLIVFP